MSKFGSLLVQDQIVGVAQIEHALQHQVLYGGDLATSLLELSLTDEETLTHYAARALGMTALSIKQLASPAKRALERFPGELAETFKIMPIRLIGNQLLAAISGPWAPETLEEVTTLAGVEEIVPQFVLSFRMAMALNQFYGVPIPPRERILQERLAPDFTPHEPSKTAPAEVEPTLQQSREAVAEEPASEAKEDPAGVVIESETTSQSRDDSTIRVFTRGQMAKGQTARNLPRVIPMPAPKRVERDAEDTWQKDEDNSEVARRPSDLTFISRPPAPHREPAFDFDEAKRKLDQAENRDQILDLIVEYGNSVFNFIIVFVIHGTTAGGRDGCIDGEPILGVRNIAIPLDQGGMFGTVFETNSYHLGPLAVNQVTEEAFRAMQRDWPQNCALMSVALRNRVILMIYGDRGQETIQSEAMSEYVRFVGLVGGAFERMVLKQKYGRQPAVPSFVPREPLGLDERSLKSWAGRYHLRSDDVEEDSSPQAEKEQVTAAAAVAAEGAPKPARSLTSGAEAIGDLPTAATVESKKDLIAVETLSSRDGRPSETPAAVVPFVSAVKATETSVSSVENTAEATTNQENRRRRPSYEEIEGVFTAQVINITQPTGRSVVVNMEEEIDRLVERILVQEPYDSTAADLLLGIGVDALQKLVRQFPGPLVIDRYQQQGRLRRIAHHGPLLRTLLKFGKQAVPFLLPLFESVDSDVRFYVTFIFSELHYPEALEKLTTRLFDSDRQIRAIAVDVLGGFKRHPEYRWAIEKVIGVLEDQNAAVDAKRFAAEALGVLRESKATVVLAEMLESSDHALIDRSIRSLIRITFRNFGPSKQRWLEWWYGNRERHRIEWAMDGLLSSQEMLRQDATSELKVLIGDVVSWPTDNSDLRQFAELRKNVGQWWEREGRELHPQKEN